MFQKELRIEAKPTNGPQPWPEHLDGCTPNFQQLSTLRYAQEYRVKNARGSVDNTYQLRPSTIEALGVFVFSAEEDYTPFAFAGDELLFVIDAINRTYEVKESEGYHFDEDEYLDTDEEDRMVVIFGFEGAFRDDSVST